MSRPIASRVTRPLVGGLGQTSSDYREPLVSQTYVSTGERDQFLQA